LLLLLAFTAPALVAAQQATQPSATSPQTSTMSVSQSAKGLCWPQVGTFASGSATVTGASVEIRILTPQKLVDPNSALYYWVGINLLNDAFIQVGYIVYRTNQARTFWEYFPPGTASEASVGFLGSIVGAAGGNGTWVKYSIIAKGTTWSTFAGNRELGSRDLKISSSDESSVYAVAEVGGTTRTDNILGPVEFRNLSYRDLNGNWHLAETGKAYIGLGAGSHIGCASSYSIAEIQGVNNYWLAGSIKHSQSLYSYFTYGDIAWPWYQLSYTANIRCNSSPGWYITGSQFSCQVPSIKPVSSTERQSFQAWTINGEPSAGPANSNFVIGSNMNVGAVYVKQYYVNVTSPYGQTQGSGWYNEGGTVKISLSPTIILNEGFLGTLGVGEQFAGWTGDYSGSNSIAQLKVDSAKSIQGEWATTYGYLPELATVIVIMLVAVIVVVLMLRKRGRP
jgi:hypothetical protein